MFFICLDIIKKKKKKKVAQLQKGGNATSVTAQRRSLYKVYTGPGYAMKSPIHLHVLTVEGGTFRSRKDARMTFGPL